MFLFPPHFFNRKLSLEEKSQIWDAYYAFRRPINEQHLSSYKAFLRLARDYGLLLTYFIVSLGSCWCLYFMWLKLGDAGLPAYSLLRSLPLLFFALFVGLAFVFDRNAVFWAYRAEFQRDAMGSAKWATLKRLKDKDLISKIDEDIVPLRVPLVPFGTSHVISMLVETFAQHCIVIGPSGCGKTSTFFMGLARSFSRIGGMIALDIAKEVAGEFYSHTVHYYDDGYRFDLMNPAYTDCFDLFGFCNNDAVNSGKVASYIIGREEGKGGNDIWDLAAEGMLKCFLLHLSTTQPDSSPSDIFDFMADHPADGKGPDGKPFNFLKAAMEASPVEDVRIEWASIFSAVGDSSPKTYGSILFTLTTKLSIFRDPKVRAALRPPTAQEIAAGRRKIDFARLRRMTANNREHTDGVKRGTAIYIVVADGEAKRLERVISTFLAVAKDILKQSGYGDDAHVLFAIDEAANGAKIPNLSEDFGVGRGRRMINVLGLQGISQLAKQYGSEVAKTIFENTGVYIIFPGAKDYTAEWTSKMLDKTTTLLRSASDATNDNFDSQKLTEHQRDLMTPGEIRQMRKFTQLLCLINEAPPIRARVNDDAKAIDPRKTKPHQIVFPLGDNAAAAAPATTKQTVIPIAPPVIYEQPAVSAAAENEAISSPTEEQATVQQPLAEPVEKSKPADDKAEDDESGQPKAPKLELGRQAVQPAAQKMTKKNGEGEGASSDLPMQVEAGDQEAPNIMNTAADTSIDDEEAVFEFDEEFEP